MALYRVSVGGGAVGNAAVGDVLSGKTFSSETAGSGATGAMANYGSKTVDGGAATNDKTKTYVSVKSAGYYNTSSKLSVATKVEIFGIDRYSTSLADSGVKHEFPNGAAYFFLLIYSDNKDSSLPSITITGLNNIELTIHDDSNNARVYIYYNIPKGTVAYVKTSSQCVYGAFAIVFA